jgi:RES domain
MNPKNLSLSGLTPPIVELPAGQSWHRVQLTKPLKGSVRVSGFILPPAGALAGRFDLADEPVAYLADSDATTLYERFFRRETRSLHIDQLKMRSIAVFTTTATLRLADLRALPEQFPVLVSQRYELSQLTARTCRDQGLHGLLYASAQHPEHACLCLFREGISRMRRSIQMPLIQASTGALHKAVVLAARGSQVPLLSD